MAGNKFTPVEKLLNTSEKLNFDKLVLAKMRQGLMSEVDTKAFGRRMLEVAQMVVRDIEAETSSSDIISDFEALRTHAESLSKAALSIASHLAGKPLANANDIKSHIDHVAKPIYHMRSRDKNLRGVKRVILSDRKGLEAEAKESAKQLGHVAELASWLATYSQSTRNEVAAAKKNPGTPAKNAFTLRMMEGWIFISGKKPSENSTPFKDALTDAWWAIHSETPKPASKKEDAWENAIRVSSKSVSKKQVNELITNGPFWK